MKIKSQQTFASLAKVCGHIPVPFIIRLCPPLLALLLFPAASQAVETVCARVKIEIKQELTLERQAFDAQMKINNTTADGTIANVAIDVKVTDENGAPVSVTTDPNNQSAKFFVRVANKQGINDITGTGSVAPQTTATINWLLIPAPGSAGANPSGKKYLVGATLKYTFGGEDTVLEVSPDVITVKPLPLLTLDYFLTQNVWADDALTPEIEPTEPFTLGVRVKNDGFATAKALKIDSAQPKIIENNQGLLISFLISGSYVDDKPAQNTLLIDFGDIPPATSKMGRWIMETSLAGKFTEFSAKFSHADELGGTLTSIVKATHPHFLLHDVWVDLPGRDGIRDFLAQDGTAVKVYESEGTDTSVTDSSAGSTLAAGTDSNGQATYLLNIPATEGFVYVKLADPFAGKKAINHLLRADGKVVSPANAWLSKTRNETTKQWQYWFNLFDVNTSGHYNADFQVPQVVAVAPAIQAVGDHQIQETRQLSFLVEASSPQGKPVSLSAGPLPQGASFLMQAADPQAPGLARGAFDWKPGKGQAGMYPITYTASDGTLSSKLTANIKVDAFTPPHGPETPTIVQPISGAEVTSLKPALSVQASTNPDDLTTQIQFEVYADEAMTELLATGQIDKAVPLAGNGGGSIPQPTVWTPGKTLTDNTPYWWRARTFDGLVYSEWANARFFANLYNDAPTAPSLIHPDPGSEVDSLTPALSWNNSTDLDGDVVTYDVAIYKDAALTNKIAKASTLAGDASGSTSWSDTVPLSNHAMYYWNVLAKDSLGAQSTAIARPFKVNTGNAVPSAPVIVHPAVGGQNAELNASLDIQNSEDADQDELTYLFEIDSVNTFDSPNKASSGIIKPGADGTTTWVTGNLVENRHYWWRAKANDGNADSAWTVGDFLMNKQNEAPDAPTVKNPGNGSWSAVLQPTLEANSVTDPEREAVRYQFEVYQNADLSQKVSTGISDNDTFVLSDPLADKKTYWWRVRALDPHDAASDWSQVAVLYVSTGPYQLPTIAVTEPATIASPEIIMGSGTDAALNVRKQVTIKWEGVDPNIEPTIALYYDTKQSGFSGTLITGGLVQKAGQQSGSTVWDVSSLPAGAYYVYATITDPKGVGKAYAPGAVVIPKLPQTGKIVLTPTTLTTSETKISAKYYVRLGTLPSANVILPLSSTDLREGRVSPDSLMFTPTTWSKDQIVTVIGVDDCAPDGTKSYQVLTGKAISVDPKYIDLSGTPVKLTNTDNGDVADTTDNANVHICSLAIITERQVNASLWEYTLSARLTNTGVAFSGVTAKLKPLSQYKIVQDTMSFGKAAPGETILSNSNIVLQSRIRTAASVFAKAVGFKWTVTVSP